MSVVLPHNAVTTVEIGDNLLPSLTVFGCSLTAVEVETGPLSDVVLPSFLSPSPSYRGHLILPHIRTIILFLTLDKRSS